MQIWDQAKANPVVYPLCIGDPEDSEQGAAARAFKEYVERESAPPIKLDLFYASQLCDETEAFHNVAKGALPFAIGGTVNIVPFAKRLGILTLPYLFASLDEAIRGTSGRCADILQEYALSAGFRVLCWTFCDFRYISNSVRPIRKLKDMRGLKFRVPQSRVMIASYISFGANPAPIAWGETYTALQQGVVDGQCYGWIGFSSMNFFDAGQKYLSEVHYTYQLQPLVVSEKFFASLQPAQQNLLIKAGEYAQKKALEWLKKRLPQVKEKLLQKGLQVFSLDDEKEWQRVAMEKVWPKIAADIGGIEAINRYLVACGKNPWLP